jgi:hypothetical protein
VPPKPSPSVSITVSTISIDLTAISIAVAAFDDEAGVVMWHGVDVISPSSWEPQEEGVMSTTANFPSVRNQGLIISRKKA